MSTPEMNNFHRIKRLPPYVFGIVNDLKAAARARGEDIIDFGMGNPDQPTPQHIVDKLTEAAQRGDTHRYSLSKGIPRLRKAICDWYKRRFDVDLDPETQAIVTIGSKEGLAHLVLACVGPGDTVLVPNPSYPIHPYGFIIAGADVRHVPMQTERGFFAELENAIHASWPRPKMLVLSFPSNPTAQCVDLAFFEKVIAIAKENDIWVVHDLAYADIVFDGLQVPSILQVPGAEEIAVECYSLSKSYICDGLNNAGWPVERPKATMFVWAKIPDAYREMGSLEFSKKLIRDAKVAASPGIGFGEYGDDYVRFGLIENEHRTRQAVRGIRDMLRKDGIRSPDGTVASA